MPQLAGRCDHVFRQPSSRDTGLALYVALAMIKRWTPNAIVTITPTDHYVAPAGEVRRAGARRPRCRRPDPRQGRGPRRDARASPIPSSATSSSATLTEVPQVKTVVGVRREAARSSSRNELRQTGALWNTMVTCGTVDALWELGRATEPQLLDILESFVPLVGTEDEEDAIEYIYRAYLPVSFSRDMLERAPAAPRRDGARRRRVERLGPPRAHRDRPRAAPFARARARPRASLREPALSGRSQGLAGQALSARRDVRRLRDELRACSRASRSASSCACSIRRRRETASTSSAASGRSGTRTCPRSVRARATAIASTGRGIRRAGLRCNPHKLLVDPYARAISEGLDWGPALLGYDGPTAAPSTTTARRTRSARSSSQPYFDWGNDRRLEIAVERDGDLRGARQGPDDAPSRRARAAARHVRGRRASRGDRATSKTLGVTAVELLPMHAFVHDGFLLERGLSNYWGYNTIGYFAPHPQYASVSRAERRGRRVQADGQARSTAPASR